MTQEIASRPWNRIYSFAGDDRWLVWAESAEDAGRSQRDQWSIWAWDSQTQESWQVARPNATAQEMGIPPDWQIGPTVRVSGGRVLWSAFERAEESTRVGLHLYDLSTRQDSVVATSTQDEYQLFFADIRGSRIAYRSGSQIIVVDGSTRDVREAGSTEGAVLVTREAVVWQQEGYRLAIWKGEEVAALPIPGAQRWNFSSTDHFITWYAASGTQLRLLDTSLGQEFKLPIPVNQGARVMGRYVAWSMPGGEHGKPKAGMYARLPER